MTQQLTFDGPALRDAGIAKLERHPWLERARWMALVLCQRKGSVTSDDLHDVMEPPPHENCYGAVFRDKRFRPTGERVQTKRASGHARWIQVWELA